jgi:hypothetical protein
VATVHIRITTLARLAGGLLLVALPLLVAACAKGGGSGY